jgi:hypothetical protein
MYIIHSPYSLHISTSHVAIFRELQYLSFVLHLAADGHMSGRNMSEVYDVYNILSYMYAHSLVLVSYLIAQCTIIDYRKLDESPLHAYFFQELDVPSGDDDDEDGDD